MCSLSIEIASADTTLLHCEPSLFSALSATRNPLPSAVTALPLPKIEPSASSTPVSNGAGGSSGEMPSGSTGVSCTCHGLQSPPNGHSTLPFQPACGANAVHGFFGS